jgi:hypothetical protein
VVNGTDFGADATLTAPAGVSFSGMTVSADGTTITATANVSASAPKGHKLPVIVTNGPAEGFGAATAKLLTIQ